MKTLTKAEEQIMQVLWDKGQAFVKDIIESLPEPSPAYNTVSTIVRILEKKGFVDHRSYGKSHEYFPIIPKEDYAQYMMNHVMEGYFDNSLKGLMSFFMKKETTNPDEMKQIQKMIEDYKNKHS